MFKDMTSDIMTKCKDIKCKKDIIAFYPYSCLKIKVLRCFLKRSSVGVFFSSYGSLFQILGP